MQLLIGLLVFTLASASITVVPLGPLCPITLKPFKTSSYSYNGSALFLSDAEIESNAPALLYTGNTTNGFAVWTYRNGFGLMAKLPLGTDLNGMELSSFWDGNFTWTAASQFASFGKGDAWVVTINRPDGAGSTFAFRVLSQVSPSDGSVVIEFGVFSYSVILPTGQLRVAVSRAYQNGAQRRSGVQLHHGSPEDCKYVNALLCG